MTSDPGGHNDSDDSQDDKPKDDDDSKPKPPPDDDDNNNTSKGGPPKNTQVIVQQRRWRGPTRRYGQAQRRPADTPARQAAFSTGPGEAVEYHYHRVPTYHHQYATDSDMASGMENNPT